MEHGPNEVLFIGVPEAARRLGVGKSLLYNQCQAGNFPHRRIGGRIVISIRVIEKMAEPPEDDKPSGRR